MTNTTDTVHPVDVWAGKVTDIRDGKCGEYYSANFQISGFTTEAEAKAFAEIARSKLAEALANHIEEAE